jgi:alpha-tubulin suppressor-like RCC1 family protein
MGFIPQQNPFSPARRELQERYMRIVLLLCLLVTALACFLNPKDPSCSGRGVCTNNSCFCDANYYGIFCQIYVSSITLVTGKDWFGTRNTFGQFKTNFTVRKVARTSNTTMFLDTTGLLWFGRSNSYYSFNSFGMADDDTQVSLFSSGFDNVWAGKHHFVGLGRNKLYTWGTNVNDMGESGVLGQNTTDVFVNIPKQIYSAPSSILDVCCSGFTTLVLLSNGQIMLFGNDNYSQGVCTNFYSFNNYVESYEEIYYDSKCTSRKLYSAWMHR